MRQLAKMLSTAKNVLIRNFVATFETPVKTRSPRFHATLKR